LRICELREKEVINICDGERLGCVEDIIFDLCKGCVTHIIVPGQCRFFGLFGREDEFIIELGCIRQIGSDVILVEVNVENVRKKC
jgi:YlmC/YmxH family sporulation protein